MATSAGSVVGRMCRSLLLQVAVLSALVNCVFAEASTKALEAEEVAGLNLGIAVMLLGSIGFMMGVFYMVNHEDKEMVVYTWKVICATISIFVSVLIYQAFNGVINQMFLEGASEVVKLKVAFLHSIIWFVVLQLFLATVSRAITWPCQLARQELTDPILKKQAAETLSLDLKCWATILGHITGFASISAWAQLQEFMGGTIFILPLAFSVLLLASKISDFIRYKVSMSDDGIEDKFEKAWDEATEETEDDVMGLTLSFLLVQTLRYYVVGVLPNEEGDFPEDVKVTDGQAFILLFLGITIGVLSYLRTIYMKKDFGRRLTVHIRLVSDFSFSWAIMFGIDAFLTTHGLGGESFGCLGEVITACILTIWAFLVIYMLDKQADKAEEGIKQMKLSARKTELELEQFEKRKTSAIRSTVLALGVLVGFAWEKCFDMAVDATAEKEADILPKSFTKMVLALLLATIVVPAWRWYILPVVKALGGFEEEEEEEEGEEGEGGEETGEACEKGEQKEGYSPPTVAIVDSQVVASQLEALRAQLEDQDRLVRRVTELEAQKSQKTVASLVAQLNEKSARVAELEQMVEELKR